MNIQNAIADEVGFLVSCIVAYFVLEVLAKRKDQTNKIAFLWVDFIQFEQAFRNLHLS